MGEFSIAVEAPVIGGGDQAGPVTLDPADPPGHPDHLGDRDHIGRDRFAVSGVFAVHGAVAGAWSSRVPWVQAHVHASLGVLGLVMITPTLGALVTMPRAALLTQRFGNRTALRILLVCWTGLLALPALMPNPLTLALVLFFFGASAGLADVVMNAAGVRVERRAGKSIMSGLHGLWAAGGIAGSGLGVLCARAGIGAPTEFLAASAVLTVLGLVVSGLLTAKAENPAGEEGGTAAKARRWALPGRLIAGIGLVGFCAVFAEGACSNWSAVYLVTVSHTTQAVAAFSVTGFALTMTVGRLSGDAIVRRFGPVNTVRFGGALALAGSATVVFGGSAVIVMLGFVLTGLGIATAVPLAIAAAGRTNQDADGAIAGVTTITYAAGLLASPAIGLLGSAVSLPFAFGLVALLTLGIGLGANALRDKTAAA